METQDPGRFWKQQVEWVWREHLNLGQGRMRVERRGGDRLERARIFC